MRVLVLCSAALVVWLQAAPPQAPPPPPPTRPPSIPGTSRGRPSLPPASPRTARPSPQRVRSATGDALDRYSRGEFERAIAVLLTVGGFELSHAQTWVLAASSPEELERRRLTAALVALEFTAARSLLSSVHYEWAATLLRERPQRPGSTHPPVVQPHAAEALWLRASVALAEGRKSWTLLTSEPFAPPANAGDGLPPFAGYLSYARARAHDDPFLAMAEAVGLEAAASHVPDMVFSVSSADARHRDRIEADLLDGSPASAGRAAKLTAAATILEPLTSDGRVAGEAHLRLGSIAMRRGDRERALGHFDRVDEATKEAFTRFLAHLFAGWTHARAGRIDDAAARYRSALAIVPRARSAATLLTAMLTSAGHLSDAERVVDEFLAHPPDSGDPWDWYLLGDYRHYTTLINQMRGMVTGTTGTRGTTGTTGARSELTRANFSLKFDRDQPMVSVRHDVPASGWWPQSVQAPVFRSGTDVVAVSVSVRSGRSFVRGLTAADFELYDNGVRQEIRAVSADAFANDVTLVVDTSGSVVRSLSRFRSDVKSIVGRLAEGDRVRLITFDTGIRQVFPMQDRSAKVPVDEIQTGDRTSLVDAIVVALARAPQPDRRHLVFVFTDGYDNASLMGYGALPELASRSESVLHLALVRVSGAPDESSSPAFRALAAAARRTGGECHPPTEDRPDVVDAFRDALDAFRQSYVLYFTPTNVPKGGWHQLSVRVTRPGEYSVSARQGYVGG